MTKIKYVGVKEDGETAYARDAGVGERWLPGSSHEVADPVLVKRLLNHPDVFAVEGHKPQAKVAVEPVAPPPAEPPAEPAPVVTAIGPGAVVGVAPPEPAVAPAPAPTPAPAPAPKKAAAKKVPAKKTAKKK